jgi:hypothetical protein
MILNELKYILKKKKKNISNYRKLDTLAQNLQKSLRYSSKDI